MDPTTQNKWGRRRLVTRSLGRMAPTFKGANLKRREEQFKT